MIDQIFQDQRHRPNLFDFFGPIAPELLNAWLQERKLIIPADLRHFWCKTGGGDMFETETVLGPLGRVDLADDVESVNQFHRQKGMPADLLIFHIGLGGLSVLQSQSGKYASVQEDSYEVQQTFVSLADWYANLIRPVYASRYNLLNT